jgi:NADH-quinone oxidoreductase subunit G
MVHGLKNASVVVDHILKGKASYDLVEVMACPGGCVGGAGQPISQSPGIVQRRAEGLYLADRSLAPLLMVQKQEGPGSGGHFPAAQVLQLNNSQDNIYVLECYEKFLGEIGGDRAHHLLHTHYQSRRRISDESFSLLNQGSAQRLLVNVCLGTNCHVKGSQTLLHSLIRYMEEHELGNIVEVRASFCLEKCGTGPNAMVDDILVPEATFEKVLAALEREVELRINNLSMKAQTAENVSTERF